MRSSSEWEIDGWCRSDKEWWIQEEEKTIYNIFVFDMFYKLKVKQTV